MATQLIATETIDERRFERIDGELVERPVANTPHTLVQSETYYLLRLQLRGSDAFVGIEWSVTRPGHASKEEPDYQTADVLVAYPPIREAKNRHLAHPPFLAIEVVSPGQGQDLIEKAIRYAAWGTPHVWIINPQTRLCLEFHGADTFTIASSELRAGDLKLNVADIFAELNRLEASERPS